MDMDARLQLFDFKTKYQFQTQPGVDQYNMPLYNVQPYVGQTTNYSGPIGMFPVYQGFLGPAFINGIQVPFQTQKNNFFNIWPNVVQNLPVVAIGNGTNGPYTISLPILNNIVQPINPPIQAILRGHVDITGVIASSNITGLNQDPPLVTTTQISNNDPFIQSIPTTSVFPAVYFTSIGTDGSNVIVADSGQFLADNQNYGLLMQPGSAPLGNLPLNVPVTIPVTPRYSTLNNTINYFTGVATGVYFPQAIPQGANINAQCYYFQSGLPRAILYYNNVLTFRSVPDRQYLVEIDAYLSPAAFLNSGDAIPFGYMAEYIARGAARKILSDTGDTEQFMFYEGLFKEQELLVWKRSQRQWTADRTHTIYSQGLNQGQSGFNNIGGSTI